MKNFKSKKEQKNINSNTGNAKEKQKPFNENFFQAMFESHQAVMLLIEPGTGTIIDANNAAATFYKYSKEELKKLKIQDINQLAPEEVKAEWMKALRDERNYFIFPHKLADGQIRQVEVYSSSFTHLGKPMLYSIIHDITEKKHAEEALLKSEEKFEIAFKSNPNALILSAVETGEIYEINDTFCNLSGLGKDEVLGKSSLDIDIYVEPEDRKKLVDLLKSKGNIKNYELTLKHRSGKLVCVLLSSEYLETSMGETMLTTLQDITERKKLEVQRNKEHDLLQIIFDTVPAMISVFDPEIKEVQLNREVERTTGWTPLDTKSKNIMELAYPDPGYRKEVAEYMQSLTPGFKDILMTCKDGSIKDTLWANVSTNDGRQIGIGIDISVRKRAQEQLAEQNKNLTRMNEVLEDFVHIAAHDLRSPIGNLLTLNDLIINQADADKKMELFRMLKPVTQRLQLTVDGLLEMVSLQVEDHVNAEKVYCKNIWKEIHDVLTPEINASNVSLEVNFSEAPEIMYARVHLVSIFKNLVSNAVKYSAEDKDSFVRVTTKRVYGYILLTVDDNGIGIDLKKAGNDLFKPFRRFTNKAEGTGLGLYIIKSIIEKNGGYIRVESQPGIGTTFYCYLKEYPSEAVS